MVLVSRFDRALDGELARTSLLPAIARVVAAERGKLLGADLSSIDPATAEVVRRAFVGAYVAAFRALLLLSAAMAAASALAAAVLVDPGVSPRDAAGNGLE